jgi:magnesium transporter
MKRITMPLESMEQQVRTLLKQNDSDSIRHLLQSRHPADVADILDHMEAEEQLQVFRLLSTQQAADVLSETGVWTTRELIKHLTPHEANELFNAMSLDDVVEILGEDVPAYQQELLAAMDPQEAREARRLLDYPLHSAGRLMTEDFVRVSSEMRVVDALQVLRNVREDVESIADLYILDPAERLQGVITLRELLRSPPEQQLEAIMQTDIVTVTPETDQEEVAWLVSQYDLFTIPVVLQSRKMVGMITVDDVIDVLVQESTEDVLRFGAVQEGATDESYFATPIWQTIRRRVGWLLLLFLTSTITVNVLGQFEQTLSQVVALSFFIPLLIGTGGNTGAQTVSTIVRSMALGEVRFGDSWRVLLRELSGGMLLGLLLSVVALGMAMLLGNSFQLALVVALSIIAICTWSNAMGALVPMVAHRFGLDPALVSAPLITTLVDATGLAIYLGIAKVVLGV